MRYEVARKLALSKIFSAIGAIIHAQRHEVPTSLLKRLRKQPTSMPLTTID